MNTDITRHRADLADLAGLQRLRQLREDSARRLRDSRRQARDAALVAVGRRQQAIHALRRDIAALARHVAGAGAVEAPRLACIAAAHREMLDDRLERAEYGLIDDEEALDAAERQLADAQAALLRCAARRQALEGLHGQVSRRVALVQELRREREAEVSRRHPLSGGWV